MTVYMTYKNCDEVEGRGPMIPDKCFKSRADAVFYIDAQPGVMGLRKKWSADKHGDWQIREVEVYEAVNPDWLRSKREVRETALAKLTPYEIEVLGVRL